MSAAAPLAGRVQELRVLLDAVEGPNSGSGVAMWGEAGIGKTRLVTEASRVLHERGVATVFGACLRMSTTVPFLPVVDVLQQLLVLESGQLMTHALNRCPTFVRGELSALVPELVVNDSAPLVQSEDDAWRRLRLFDATRRLLVAFGEQTPVVVVIEDLHWADPSTLELLDYLLAAGHRTGVPLVITGRLEEADAGWLESTVIHGGMVRLELGLLNLEETREQVAGLLNNTLGDRDAQRIYRRTGGHPFYVEQLVSAVGPSGGGELPAGLRSLLSARVADATNDERRVMALLAIAGRALAQGAIASACDWPVEQAEDVVRGLARRRLVDSASEGCKIRHALLGEVVMSEIASMERRSLHRSVAEFLSTWDDPAVAAEVAEHWGETSDVKAELLWRVRAAQHSDSVGAQTDAAAHWMRVIDLWNRGGGAPEPLNVSLAQAYRRACAALTFAGRRAEAAALGEAALTLFDRPGVEASVRADVCVMIGRQRALNGDPSATDLLRRAVEIGRGLPASRNQARRLLVLARHLYALRHATDDEQDDLLGQTLMVARACRAHGIERNVLSMRAAAALVRGEAAESLHQANAVLTFKPDVADPNMSAGAAANALHILLLCGHYDEVISKGVPELAWVEQHGNPGSWAGQLLRGKIIGALRERGRLAEAVILSAVVGDEDPTETLQTDRALLTAVTGSPERAMALWREARDLVLRLPSTSLIWGLVACGVEIAIWARQPQEALTAALPVLHGAAGTVESRFSGELFVLSARACADLAASGRAVDDAAETATVLHAADELESTLTRCVEDPFNQPAVPVSARANALTWSAELTRLRGASDPGAWGQAAAAWDDLGTPHRVAYALLRQAEALLVTPRRRRQAAAVLRRAAVLADEHALLQSDIAALAARARISLSDSAAPRRRDARNTTAFGLTAREIDVLHLLGDGRTNAEIAATLFISPRTVGVHVGSILRKLHASSRVQAGAIAQELNLRRDDA
jgi:DNA-binding CsgD family transcriptional regulator